MPHCCGKHKKAKKEITVFLAYILFNRQQSVKEVKIRSLNREGQIDPFILLIIISLLVILAGGVFFAYKMGGKSMQNYSIEDQNRPKIEIEKTHVDLGNMKISDTKSEKIAIKNIGERTLQVTSVKTSCGCTTAQVEIDGEKSPMFSMHNNPTWTGEIGPGKKAILKAIYEPSKMPIQGQVERTIFFKTNDPENPDVAIHMVAKVD